MSDTLMNPTNIVIGEKSVNNNVFYTSEFVYTLMHQINNRCEAGESIFIECNPELYGPNAMFVPDYSKINLNDIVGRVTGCHLRENNGIRRKSNLDVGDRLFVEYELFSSLAPNILLEFRMFDKLNIKMGTRVGSDDIVWVRDLKVVSFVIPI